MNDVDGMPEDETPADDSNKDEKRPVEEDDREEGLDAIVLDAFILESEHAKVPAPEPAKFLSSESSVETKSFEAKPVKNELPSNSDFVLVGLAKTHQGLRFLYFSLIWYICISLLAVAGFGISNYRSDSLLFGLSDSVATQLCIYGLIFLWLVGDVVRFVGEVKCLSIPSQAGTAGLMQWCVGLRAIVLFLTAITIAILLRLGLPVFESVDSSGASELEKLFVTVSPMCVSVLVIAATLCLLTSIARLGRFLARHDLAELAGELRLLFCCLVIIHMASVGAAILIVQDAESRRESPFKAILVLNIVKAILLMIVGGIATVHFGRLLSQTALAIETIPRFAQFREAQIRIANYNKGTRPKSQLAPAFWPMLAIASLVLSTLSLGALFFLMSEPETSATSSSIVGNASDLAPDSNIGSSVANESDENIFSRDKDTSAEEIELPQEIELYSVINRFSVRQPTTNKPREIDAVLDHATVNKSSNGQQYTITTFDTEGPIDDAWSPCGKFVVLQFPDRMLNVRLEDLRVTHSYREESCSFVEWTSMGILVASEMRNSDETRLTLIDPDTWLPKFRCEQSLGKNTYAVGSPSSDRLYVFDARKSELRILNLAEKNVEHFIQFRKFGDKVLNKLAGDSWKINELVVLPEQKIEMDIQVNDEKRLLFELETDKHAQLRFQLKPVQIQSKMAPPERRYLTSHWNANSRKDRRQFTLSAANTNLPTKTQPSARISEYSAVSKGRYVNFWEDGRSQHSFSIRLPVDVTKRVLSSSPYQAGLWLVRTERKGSNGGGLLLLDLHASRSATKWKTVPDDDSLSFQADLLPVVESVSDVAASKPEALIEKSAEDGGVVFAGWSTVEREFDRRSKDGVVRFSRSDKAESDDALLSKDKQIVFVKKGAQLYRVSTADLSVNGKRSVASEGFLLVTKELVGICENDQLHTYDPATLQHRGTLRLPGSVSHAASSPFTSRCVFQWNRDDAITGARQFTNRFGVVDVTTRTLLLDVFPEAWSINWKNRSFELSSAFSIDLLSDGDVMWTDFNMQKSRLFVQQIQLGANEAKVINSTDLPSLQPMAVVQGPNETQVSISVHKLYTDHLRVARRQHLCATITAGKFGTKLHAISEKKTLVGAAESRGVYYFAAREGINPLFYRYDTRRKGSSYFAQSADGNSSGVVCERLLRLNKNQFLVIGGEGICKVTISTGAGF